MPNRPLPNLSSLPVHRPRLLFSTLLGFAVWALLPDGEGSVGGIVAFDAGAVAFLALTMQMFWVATPAHMRRRAEREDVGKAVILTLSVGAAIVGFAAIVVLLHGLKDMPPAHRPFALMLGGGSVLCSWLVTHTLFALHYAHVFYGDTDGNWDTPDRNEGLVFPATQHPGYWDFLYFSMVLGMTAQTSDVNITSSRMRRVVLIHSVLSFFFNTVILALSVNVAASF